MSSTSNVITKHSTLFSQSKKGNTGSITAGIVIGLIILIIKKIIS